jgi:hypothetical protein
MIVLYPYPMLSTEGLKSFFALNCLFSTGRGLQMDVGEARVLVNKDGS